MTLCSKQLQSSHCKSRWFTPQKRGLNCRTKCTKEIAVWHAVLVRETSFTFCISNVLSRFCFIWKRCSFPSFVREGMPNFQSRLLIGKRNIGFPTKMKPYYFMEQCCALTCSVYVTLLVQGVLIGVRNTTSLIFDTEVRARQLD